MQNRKKLVIVAMAAVALCGGATASANSAKKSGKESAAASMCRKSISQFVENSEPIMPLGIVVANIHDFENTEASALRAEYKMNDRLQIVSIAKDSVAERIGLKVGDVIMEINGIYVPKGPQAIDQLTDRVLPQIDWSKPLQATILRGGYAQILAAPENAAFASAENKDTVITR